MTMSAIRPVTGRWPSSAALWEETSLPLAFTIKPFSQFPAKLSLTQIPKCLHCGAPQQDTTHYPVHGGTSNLCHLCGKITSKLYEHQVVERRHELLLESEYRRRGVPDSVFALPLSYEKNTIYTLPAMTCPPVWWIVVDGTTSANRDYWNTLGTTLRNVCRDMPPYVHIGLLVSSPESLAVWDLSSAVPHVKHVEWNYSSISLPLSPATCNLQAALRALGDMASTSSKKTGSMPLGATIQVILDTMQSTSHPGNSSNKIPAYAGGRILCILGGNAPIEVKARRLHPPTGETGTGGFGGSCARIGQRYTTTTTTNTTHSSRNGDPELGNGQTEPVALPESDETDMTATNLTKLHRNNWAELYYSELGQQCARAALGVDVLVLDTTSNASTNVGIPFLRQLSDRSGAPGPIICSDPESFEKQVSLRTPWQNDVVFGGKLRVRMSPGFAVDSTAVEGTGEEGPQLAPLYSSGGIMGPASHDADNGLWLMGCCDKHTALTVDLVVNKSVQDRVYVDGMGDVAVKHAIQTCFAYTAIEQQEDGSFVTVRRMKIASLHLPLAHDTESLYATLDPEALAVTLFHKLTIASLQDGLIQTHEIGQQWLQSLLSCVYRSAEQEEELQKEQISRGLDNMNPVFYPQERLLNRNGELSAEDVLLAQGHDRLNTVSFMVFALLQCDALRPNMGSYQPSIDARSAASAQMYSMLPSVLARCIAPRLELWSASGDENEPITEDMDLNLEHIGMGVMEHRQTGPDELLLFVDSPREIVLYDSRHVQPNDSNASSASIGKGLERCIESAAKSYRIPPPIIYELDLAESQEALARFKDILVEDSATVQGLQNYVQWKQDIAAMVQEALER